MTPAERYAMFELGDWTVSPVRNRALEVELAAATEAALASVTDEDVKALDHIPSVRDTPHYRAVLAELRYQGGLMVIQRCTEIIADPKFTTDQAANAFAVRERMIAKHIGVQSK